MCGGGAAGMAAAIAAARAGRSVLLVEATTDVGGTMADALLHTLAGLYDSRGEPLNPGLPRELEARLTRADLGVRRRRMGRVWVLSVDPNVYRATVRSWLVEEANVELRCATRVSAARLDAGGIRELALQGPRGLEWIPVAAVVDASGSAAVARAVGGDRLLPAPTRAAAGFVFRMRGAAPGAFVFPRNLDIVRALRAAATSGALPPECQHAWIDTGIEEDEIFVKLFVPLAEDWDSPVAQRALHDELARTQRAVAEFITRQSGFERAFVTQVGRLGLRDAGRVRGEYVLTKSDVLGLRRFEDAACRCAWPIEYWDSSRGASIEYLPDEGFYEIPLRALAVAGVANLWAAGKCLSADPFAQASARCVGTCWAMGEAAGKAAATLRRIGAHVNPEESSR